MLVLGINHSNDSAAALVRDGVVIAASREERFSRVKHDSAFPSRAIGFCLSTIGAQLADVDAVAFFWNPALHAATPNRRMSGGIRHHLEYLYSAPNHLLPMLGAYSTGPLAPTHMEQRIPVPAIGKDLRILYVTHHLCHAASVLFRSPFAETAILTVDGYGERSATSFARGSGLAIEQLGAIDFPHSVGSMYAAFTQYLGFRANNGEGKVMGLASYGTDRLVGAVRELVALTDDGFKLDLEAFAYFHEHGPRYSERLVDLFGPPRTAESELTQHHKDVARGLQAVTEELLLHLARIAGQKAGPCSDGKRRLGMAGGVVLNCVANGRIMREAGFDACFFQPAADDAGTSMGAALWASHCLLNQPRPERVTATDYLGLRNTDAQVEAALKQAAVAYRKLDDAPEAAAAAVAEGKIIGWYQGAAEFGPRALGNRSIVADPRNAANKDTLNARVKFREPFRPFAPSCLEEAVGELFDCDVPSPYMLRVYDTLPERLQDLGAVTHVDGGARVQTVNADQNPRYYALIKAFGERTGVPCVLNTSFNIRGEPIVNTVQDALKCFLTTDMDELFLHDFHVVKAR